MSEIDYEIISALIALTGICIGAIALVITDGNFALWGIIVFSYIAIAYLYNKNEENKLVEELNNDLRLIKRILSDKNHDSY